MILEFNKNSNKYIAKDSKKELEKAINKSLKEIEQDKIVGPFNNTKELIKSLSKILDKRNI